MARRRRHRQGPKIEDDPVFHGGMYSSTGYDTGNKDDHRLAEEGRNSAGGRWRYVTWAEAKRHAKRELSDDPEVHADRTRAPRLIRPRTSERIIQGASPKAIERFKEMQHRTRESGHKKSWLSRFRRRPTTD